MSAHAASRVRARSTAPISAALFLCLFAAQSAVIATAPVLAQLAADLHVSTAAAGQLRTITGLAAGLTALALGALARRIGLGRQLLASAMLLALGSAGSAAAGNYAVLALAQVPVGAAVAVMTTAAVLAAAEWVPADARTSVLSWALIGQPAAWIVGMPLVGLVGGHSWRLGWLVLPLVAALAAGALVAPRARNGEDAAREAAPSARSVLAHPLLARWLLSELLANAGWAGTLVYAGALFTETYGISSGETGVLLAAGAAAYVAGNVSARSMSRRASPRMLSVLALCLVVTNVAFGIGRTGVAASTALFCAAAVVAGARTLVASAYGLAVAPAVRTTLTSLRAATMQFGYFAGSVAGGLALSANGYSGVGIAMGLFFLAAAAALASPAVRAAPAVSSSPC